MRHGEHGDPHGEQRGEGVGVAQRGGVAETRPRPARARAGLVQAGRHQLQPVHQALRVVPPVGGGIL